MIPEIGAKLTLHGVYSIDTTLTEISTSYFHRFIRSYHPQSRTHKLYRSTDFTTEGSLMLEFMNIDRLQQEIIPIIPLLYFISYNISKDKIFLREKQTAFASRFLYLHSMFRARKLKKENNHTPNIRLLEKNFSSNLISVSKKKKNISSSPNFSPLLCIQRTQLPRLWRHSSTTGSGVHVHDVAQCRKDVLRETSPLLVSLLSGDTALLAAKSLQQQGLISIFVGMYLSPQAIFTPLPLPP